MPPPEGEALEALRRLDSGEPTRPAVPALLDSPPDVAALEQAEERDLLAGEAELHRRARLAVPHGSFAAWVGWAPSAALGELGEALRRTAPRWSSCAPAWVEPPTLLARAGRGALPPARPVLRHRPYRDIDPTLFTASRSS